MRRYVIVFALLALQIGGTLYYYHCMGADMRQIRANAVPADAPRMRVQAHYSWHGYVGIGSGATPRLADTPFFGRSLWWGDDWQQHVNARAEAGLVHLIEDAGKTVGSAEALAPMPLRPAPGAEVRGARRIPTEGSVPVAVFWRKGEDALHTICRIEARGSSEDSPREGELRTLGELQTDKLYDYDVWAEREGGQLLPRPFVSLFIEAKEHSGAHPFITYPLTRAELRTLRAWRRGYADPDYTMELALPPGESPVPTALFINGHPLEAGLSYMRRGHFPPKRQ